LAEDAAEGFAAAERAIIAGDEITLAQLLPTLASAGARHWHGLPQNPVSLSPRDASGDARSILLREHHVTDWPTFVALRETWRVAPSPIARFEAAADAVVAGDLERLDLLLRTDPALARARSQRTHHATLLHYVGANGIENYRQKTPANIVAIADRLLDAGAAIDAPADMYGGRVTTLALVATSVHPDRAGVQEAMMAALVRRGARVDGAMVNAALANGRPAAASWLAEHGATLDVEGAAGTGRLTELRNLLNAGGASASAQAGLRWAAEYGHVAVVELLLDRGVDIDAQDRHGMTALHWAAVAGQAPAARALIARGASLEARNATWNATPLVTAVWSAEQETAGAVEVVALLVDAGARTDVTPRLAERVRAVLDRSRK
jgi:hypothetical protein